MATSFTCLIHNKRESGPLTNFTEVSFKRFLDYRRLWVSLDGNQREIAERSYKVIGDNVEEFRLQNIRVEDFVYHRACYSSFTNKSALQRAQVRCQRKCQAIEESQSNATRDLPSADGEFGEQDTTPRKVLRSHLTSSTPVSARSKNPHVLSPVCIICNKETLYITDSVSFYY